jgi:hypothetical protein
MIGSKAYTVWVSKIIFGADPDNDHLGVFSIHVFRALPPLHSDDDPFSISIGLSRALRAAEGGLTP